VKHFKISISILICSLYILFFSGVAAADSYKEIYEWVKSEMNIDKDYPMPSVEIVSKEKLNEIFAAAIDESYKKMEGQMGQDEAKKIMEFYLDEVIGLFIPETKAIYVSNLSDRGERESTIAHEIVHYLQDIVDGVIDSGDYMADQKRLYREMQAGDIGDRYLKAFYGDD
jgi:hypothetical protein